jgi:hypothetical protein
MNERVAYVFSPSTLITIVSTIVGMAVAWTALKWKVDQLEKDIKELQWYELHVKIIEMQKDIQYMREMFDKILNEKK